MAFFLQPPSNFLVGPGNLDPEIKADSPTPELLEESPSENLPEPRQYSRDMVKVLTRLWDHECAANSDRWDKISRGWEQVNLNYPSDLDSDQPEIRLPEALMTTKQIVGVLFGMIEQSPDWWAAEAKTPSKECFVHLIRDLVNDQLKNPRVNWWDIVEEGFDSLVITGHVSTIVAVKYGETPQFGQGEIKSDVENPDDQKGPGLFSPFQSAPADSEKPFIPNNKLPMLHFRNIPSEYCNKDSSGERLYHIWSLDLPVGLIFMSSEKMGWDKEALLRAKERGFMPNDSSSMVSMVRTNRPRALDRSTSKLIRLTFFEGDLVDLETGATLFEKKFVVMANNCEIVYGPAEIPWWDGEGTIVDAPFISIIHDIYGRGLISENADAFSMSGTVTNQMLSYLCEALLGAYEYDADRMRNEAQRSNLKLYPRAVIPVEGDSSQPAIRRLPMGDVANSAFQVTQALDMRKQSTTGMDQAGGNPRGRQRMSKGEYDARTGDKGQLWKNIFRNIQSKWLSPLLRLSCLRLLQSYPQPLWKKYVTQKKEQLLTQDVSLDPQKKAAWDAAYDKCANWSPEERFAELSDFDFNVTVFTTALDRQGRVEKGAFFMRNIAGIPGAAQEVNWRYLTRQMATDLGYDSEKILNKANQTPPSADVTSVTSTLNPDEDQDIPDVTGGFGGMPTPGYQPPHNGAFPGGPTSLAPNPPTPPPGT